MLLFSIPSFGCLEVFVLLSYFILPFKSVNVRITLHFAIDLCFQFFINCDLVIG